MKIMKKLSLLLALLLVVGSLCACGNAGGTSPTTTTKAPETTEEQLPDVTLAFQKDQIADEAIFVGELEKYGGEVVDMSDAGGGYMCTFTNDEYKRLMTDKHAATVKALKEYENTETGYIERIVYNEDFRDLNLYVNREKYDSADADFTVYAVSAQVLAYKIYLGEGQRTFVKVFYADTEEEITSFSMPMNIELS